MRKIRHNTFETNSSSTHSLTIGNKVGKNYSPLGDTIKIRFIDTDNEFALNTLKDKISYLVSHIISWYKYDVASYEDLIEQVKRNYDFIELENYVMENYGKKIVFPSSYKGNIEDIVNINHQLISWNKSLKEVIEDMMLEKDIFKDVLEDGYYIEFGRD